MHFSRNKVFWLSNFKTPFLGHFSSKEVEWGLLEKRIFSFILVFGKLLIRETDYSGNWLFRKLIIREIDYSGNWVRSGYWNSGNWIIGKLNIQEIENREIEGREIEVWKIEFWEIEFRILIAYRLDYHLTIFRSVIEEPVWTMIL